MNVRHSYKRICYQVSVKIREKQRMLVCLVYFLHWYFKNFTTGCARNAALRTIWTYNDSKIFTVKLCKRKRNYISLKEKVFKYGYIST